MSRSENDSPWYFQECLQPEHQSLAPGGGATLACPALLHCGQTIVIEFVVDIECHIS